MPLVVGVVLRKIKDKVYADTRHHDLVIGDNVVVETEHGQETGMVCEREKMVDKEKNKLGKILRKINNDDKKRIEDLEFKNKKALNIVNKKIEEHKLDMKLTCVQYTFDKSKVFVYYTAENRVDFREFIKDLGHQLKTRIQMVQIGVRDESKIIGGLGTCGRELCCRGFLKNFSSVTIDMAKEQNLSLNTAKLSGLCGRLMCCLSYEHEHYKETKKKLPNIGSKINTPDGQGVVKEINCIKEEITVEFNQGQPKSYPAQILKQNTCKKFKKPKEKK